MHTKSMASNMIGQQPISRNPASILMKTVFREKYLGTSTCTVPGVSGDECKFIVACPEAVLLIESIMMSSCFNIRIQTSTIYLALRFMQAVDTKS